MVTARNLARNRIATVGSSIRTRYFDRKMAHKNVNTTVMNRQTGGITCASRGCSRVTRQLAYYHRFQTTSKLHTTSWKINFSNEWKSVLGSWISVGEAHEHTEIIQFQTLHVIRIRYIEIHTFDSKNKMYNTIKII